MAKQYYACLYGGASDNIAAHLRQKIEYLGKLLVENGFSLVYGAGATGCMGAIARGVRQSDGYIMGVTPSFMGNFEQIFDCDNTIKVETMAERKTLMEKHADVYLIAPGGIGTMDEFFQILTLKYLKRIDTPIVVLNLEGFYDSLLNLIDDLIAKGVAGDVVKELFEVVDSVENKRLQTILQNIQKN